MAERDPTKPQLDFPDLVAELITQLRLRGQVGLLDFSDVVIPTFLVGSRGVNFSGDPSAFSSAGVVTSSAAIPPANFVLIDTGPLPAGTYNVYGHLSLIGTTAAFQVSSLQHRDAANAATLTTLARLPIDATNRIAETVIPLIGYEIGLNERLRVLSPSGVMTAGGIVASIFFQRRVTP